jgi:hypothetical protein
MGGKRGRDGRLRLARILVALLAADRRPLRGDLMKPFRAAAACAALVLLCSRPASCAPSAFTFLEVPAGARASALGGAFASLAQGVEAAFWNPAGLEGVKGIQITGTHVEYLQKLRHEQFAIAGRVLGGGLAASLRALYSEPIEERDELGNLTPEGAFGYHDLEFALAYGHFIAAGLSVGGTVQAVRERMADVSASTYAAGFGAVWAPARVGGLRLGLSAHNLGKDARYELDDGPGALMPLPAAVQAGGSWQSGLPHGTVLRTALEGRFTRGRTGIGMVGVEVATLGGANGAGAAALRGGLRVNDDTSSFSLGVGYALSGLRVDYAFVPLRLDLGDTQRIAFTAQF